MGNWCNGINDAIIIIFKNMDLFLKRFVLFTNKCQKNVKVGSQSNKLLYDLSNRLTNFKKFIEIQTKQKKKILQQKKENISKNF